MDDQLKFIAPMPRLKRRRLGVGCPTAGEPGIRHRGRSHHVSKGWQLGPIAAMAFAAASTSRVRVLSLVAQNGLQHPALLAKDIATIDRLSGGRAELGIGASWLADDYVAFSWTARTSTADANACSSARPSFRFAVMMRIVPADDASLPGPTSSGS